MTKSDSKPKAGTRFGQGHFGGLDGWADDVATRVKWREQDARQDRKGRR